MTVALVDADLPLPAYHALTAAETAHRLATDAERGLTAAEAAGRLARFGPNVLPEAPPERWPARVLRQIREPMSLLLLAAALLAGIALRETADALAIGAIVVLNVAIGLVQEGRAAHALAALRTLETPVARVVREGHAALVPGPELVPGDVVVLAAGDRVPADLRVAAAVGASADESLLSGESLPVEKDVAAVDADAVDADRRSVLFGGTLLTRGTARGIVTATGASTALGRIAGQLGGRDEPTPMQRELSALSATLGRVAVAVAAVVFAFVSIRLGVSHGGLQRSFLIGVALAVAAVPEGLATVVTIGLARGVRRMARRGALVRRLPAVETLGCTTVILTDKTGTLTENRLHVSSALFLDGDRAALHALPPALRPAVEEAVALCSDASVEPAAGDPLEIALLEDVGEPHVSAWRAAGPRGAEVAFDSDRKRMTTLNRTADGLVLFVKGAPETVLGLCATARAGDGGTTPLDATARERLLERIARHARSGERLLAIARRTLDTAPETLEEAERDLTLLAVAGLRDPLRPAAAATVAQARAAGIEIVMVTGDHAGTAAWVAEEAGLIGAGERVVTGRELRERGLPPNPLASFVYARIEPDQKRALAVALQDAGHVVAVTGDGVNDAPALRQADIGVAMGRGGTDVAREAADIVLTDSNLGTVIAAVREGRAIYERIRKVVDYLVAGNLSEILVVIGSLLLFPALGPPLLPLQLLWINLITDGLPALALGVDPSERDIMRRAPRDRASRLIDARRMRLLGARAAVIAAAPLAALAIERFVWNEPWAHARAAMFAVLIGAHLLYALLVRRPGARAPFGNRWLLAAIGAAALLQVVLVTWPPAQRLFDTAPLLAREWALVAAGSVVPLLVLAAAERAVRRPAIEPSSLHSTQPA